MGKDLKTALVVGATGYLGRAVAAALTAAGWGLVPTWLEKHHPDVRNENAYLGLPEALDAVIYLPGKNKVESTHYILEEDWDEVHDVTLKGAFLCARAAYPALLRASPSCFIAISSIMVTHPYPQRAAYASAKAGLEGLVRALAVEWGKDGISSTAIRLGHLDRLMTTTTDGNGLLQSTAQRTPRGENISPDEVAKYILWLCEGGASLANGSVSTLDSAYTINRWPL